MIVKNPLRFLLIILTAFVAGMLSYGLLTSAYSMLLSRTGFPGGEIFVIPLMCLLVYLGWEAKGIFGVIKE